MDKAEVQQKEGRKRENSGRSKTRSLFLFLPDRKFLMTSGKKSGILILKQLPGAVCIWKEMRNWTSMDKSLRIKVAVGTIFICIALTLLAVTLINKYTPSETMRALDRYYDVAPDEAVVLMENEIFEEKALLREGGLYLPAGTVFSLLNDGFYLDEEEHLLSLAWPEELIRAAEGESQYYRNDEACSLGHPVFFKLGDVYYVSLEFTALFSDMTYQFYENPNRVVIHYQWIDFLYYDTVEDSTPIRVEPDIKSDILRLAPEGETLYYIGGTGAGGRSFVKVMTQDGIFGYVQKKFLGESYYDVLQSSYIEPEYSHISQEERVLLGWHQVTVPKANDNLEQIVANARELTVISPTWYRLTDTEGNISSLADAGYVERAHAMGLKVWALIDNFNPEVSTHELLASSAARTKLIDHMMAEARQYGFDGWNIDFETLSAKTGPHYIQFLKELSIQCRKEGLVLSVDNYVPAPYNDFYDLETQGRIVDYVVIMAYDEHYSGSETAGSVASLGFLKEAVSNTLEKVPKERVIMAIPFYTRLWAEQDIGGTVKLSSEALTMESAKKVLESNGVTAVWDVSTAQNYAEYEKDGILYKIWLEDVDSLHERLRVIAGADTAGIAAWRLGYETEEIWPVIGDYMK